MTNVRSNLRFFDIWILSFVIFLLHRKLKNDFNSDATAGGLEDCRQSFDKLRMVSRVEPSSKG